MLFLHLGGNWYVIYAFRGYLVCYFCILLEKGGVRFLVYFCILLCLIQRELLYYFCIFGVIAMFFVIVFLHIRRLFLHI
ncbi:hypothetical protein ACS0TY_011603 [Phlomoides rotata]